MSSEIKKVVKLNHKQFRALLKKFRRKKKRQLLAQKRDREGLLEQQRKENSPHHIELEADRRRNAQLYDEFEERERKQQHKLWLWREEQAQILFKKKQEQLELDKIQREKERKRILEEFEKQQTIENEKAEENLKARSQKEEAYQEALANLPEGDGPWHNPIAPENYDTGQEKNQCQFYAKTGCCRFGDRCSRGHIRPAISTTILIRGMFSHFSIEHTGRDDYDTDMGLEYEDRETYKDFKTFYEDVLPEFKQYGKVLQFKVCSNHEPHLRGNVFVQYSKESEASEAYKNLNGRYYAGKQLTCEFSNVIKWRSAICGLYFRKLCPKGVNCNFLHVFKNPSDEFWEADRDLPAREPFHSSQSHRSWRNSDRHSSRHSYSNSHRYYRDNSPDHYRDNYHNSSSRRRRSSSSDSDVGERSPSYSSQQKYKDRKEYSSKRKHRDSRSKSRSPHKSPERSNHHKKHKSKKKKKKKSKRRSSSDESEH